jgi:hypothetical protein
MGRGLDRRCETVIAPEPLREGAHETLDDSRVRPRLAHSSHSSAMGELGVIG